MALNASGLEDKVKGGVVHVLQTGNSDQSPVLRQLQQQDSGFLRD